MLTSKCLQEIVVALRILGLCFAIVSQLDQGSIVATCMMYGVHNLIPRLTRAN